MIYKFIEVFTGFTIGSFIHIKITQILHECQPWFTVKKGDQKRWFIRAFSSAMCGPSVRQSKNLGTNRFTGETLRR